MDDLPINPVPPQDRRLPAEAAVAPAEGERRAIRGFAAQYLFAATRILASLRSRQLLWIRVADPEAGRVDDLQVGSRSQVDGYQVKWNRFPAAFSFSDLRDGRGGDRSLIAQLADGWKRLTVLHASRRVVVHLVTNDVPSVNDSLPGTEGLSRGARRYRGSRGAQRGRRGAWVVA